MASRTKCHLATRTTQW